MYFHDLQFQTTECLKGPNRPQMRLGLKVESW
jgi:hypothetical protein